MQGLLQEMSAIGYRFTGTGGGRLYFSRTTDDGVELMEFKSWDEVRAFCAGKTGKGEKT